MANPKKIPTIGPKKLRVHSKKSGLDMATKRGASRTADYTVGSSRNDAFWANAEKHGVAKKPNFQNMPKGNIFISGGTYTQTPFKMRSGNTTPFKQMGSSPLKQEELTPYEYTLQDDAIEFGREYDKKKKSGHHRKHTKGPEAVRPPKDAVVRKPGIVRAHTGFGPEADANMTRMINDPKPSGGTKKPPKGRIHPKWVNFKNRPEQDAAQLDRLKHKGRKKKIEAVKNVIKKYGKKALRVGRVAGSVGSKFAGPVGALVTAAEVGSYLYKNRKDIEKGGDKVMKKRYERSKGGFDPFTSKY
tara:strand:+ start:145 stop:1047 length:903 start_codon:yes stop_codon:yes gene_type:complete